MTGSLSAIPRPPFDVFGHYLYGQTPIVPKYCRHDLKLLFLFSCFFYSCLSLSAPASLSLSLSAPACLARSLLLSRSLYISPVAFCLSNNIKSHNENNNKSNAGTSCNMITNNGIVMAWKHFLAYGLSLRLWQETRYLVAKTFWLVCVSLSLSYINIPLSSSGWLPRGLGQCQGDTSPWPGREGAPGPQPTH